MSVLRAVMHRIFGGGRSRPRQAILDALGPGEWLYGQQIVERSGGRLGHGTVYVHLALLEEEGVIESMREPLPLEDRLMGCLPRPLYRLAVKPESA